MQTDAATLIKLLENLDRELTLCISHKQKLGHNAEISDPVLLGDFVVETYNRYLSAAQSLFDSPLLQGASPIEPLGDIPDAPYEIEKGVGHHPRVVKMIQVAMAVRHLKTMVEGGGQPKANRKTAESRAALSLLENLGAVLDRPHADSEDSGALIRLAKEYNRCLERVMASGNDPVVGKMFQPLALDDGASFQAKLTELRLAQSGLLRYLRDARERAPRPPRPAIAPVPAIAPSSPDAPVAQSFRNPFGEPFDPPNPDAEENRRFAEISSITGGDNDPNAEQWADFGRNDFDTINGVWMARDRNDSEPDEQDMREGRARIGQIGDRVFIRAPHEAEDTVYLIEARREGNRLIGQYADREKPENTGPWVGIIVSNRRIDGEYGLGRYDFRR